MKRNRFPKDDLSSYRAALDADDGQDPRDFFKPEAQCRGRGRKTLQLCAQVADTLQQLLAEVADPLIQSLQVIEVRPAPDASQLLVLVAPLAGALIDTPETEAALNCASGWLRSEVAAAVHRKRAPRLRFRVLPESGTQEAQP